MASNIINKSNTTISDSSESDLSQNSTEKIPKNNSGQNSRTKAEFNYELDTELCIDMTEAIEQKRKKNHSNVSEKTVYHLITAIINDNKASAEKIIKSSNSQAQDIINYTTKDGMCPIHYAVIYGSYDCLLYLLGQKAQTNKTCEGLHLIHLSLMRGIFVKYQDKCLKTFNYIYNNLQEQRKYSDRLGRSYLHIIFEYDFHEALNDKIITTEDLFLTDKNGEYVINYIYIYNSGKCFWKVAKDPNFLANLYKEIRNRFAQNKKFMLKEKFLDNLFLHQNFYIIAIIVVNSINFEDELMEDLNNLKKFYSQYEQQNKNDIDTRNMYQISQNINYVINILEKLSNKDTINQKDMHFDFPQKIQELTGIVFNDKCIKHLLLPDEPLKHSNIRYTMFENSDRLACLIDEDDGIIMNDRVFHFKGINSDLGFKFRNSGQGSGSEFILFFRTERKSTLNDILKCHDICYIERLKNLCEQIKNENVSNTHSKNKNENNKNNHNKNENNINYNLNCINTNPLYKESIEDKSHYFKYKKFDEDTYLNEYSYENIYNTTGCVFDAIDLVMQGTVRNAFALVRPPGHHSGYYGPVENPLGTSGGFCIVNNIAIGAAYAKYKYRNEIKRIAIIDFDVHHGNGTEEIIQMLKGKQFKHSIQTDHFGTFINKQNKRLNWLDFDDAKNMLFISTHLYFEDNPKIFYPYTGGLENNTQKEDEIYPGGILNIPFGPKNNNPMEYRNIIKTKLIPRLHKFKPDLIMISAGFDGHENEYINKGKMKLNEFDFAFMTQQIQLVANKYCNGRVISILEGGYNVSSGLVSSFAQSAFFHARFLNSSINMFHCYDFKLTGNKRKNDSEEDLEVLEKMNKMKTKIKKNDKNKHNGDRDIDDD